MYGPSLILRPTNFRAINNIGITSNQLWVY